MAFPTNKKLERQAKSLEDRIVDAILMNETNFEPFKKEAKMLLEEQYITPDAYKSFINIDLYKEMYS